METIGFPELLVILGVATTQGISATRQPLRAAPASLGVSIRVTDYLRCNKRRVLGSVSCFSAARRSLSWPKAWAKAFVTLRRR